jgi:hypothetical protein
MSDQIRSTSPAQGLDDPNHYFYHLRHVIRTSFTTEEANELAIQPNLPSALQVLYTIDLARQASGRPRLSPEMRKFLADVGAAPRLFNGEPELLREVRYLAKHLDDISVESIERRMVEYYPSRRNDILLAINAWQKEVDKRHPGTAPLSDTTTTK